MVGESFTGADVSTGFVVGGIAGNCLAIVGPEDALFCERTSAAWVTVAMHASDTELRNSTRRVRRLARETDNRFMVEIIGPSAEELEP